MFSSEYLEIDAGSLRHVQKYLVVFSAMSVAQMLLYALYFSLEDEIVNKYVLLTFIVPDIIFYFYVFRTHNQWTWGLFYAVSELFRIAFTCFLTAEMEEDVYIIFSTIFIFLSVSLHAFFLCM